MDESLIRVGMWAQVEIVHVEKIQGRHQRDNGTHAGSENGFDRVILLMEGGPVIPH